MKDKTKKILVINYIIALCMGILFIVFNPHPQGAWGFDNYNVLGQKLASGEGYVSAFRMPAYPILLAIFFKIFGYRYMPILIFQALLNAFICLIIFQLVKNIFNKWLTIFISFLVAFIGISNIYVSILSTDMMTTFLFALSILCLYKGYKENRAVFYFLHGIILSLAVLMRPSMVLLPFFYFLAILFILNKIKSAGKYLFYAILGVSLLLIPWIARNYYLSKEIIPLTTQGWSQLFYGIMQSGKYFECRTYNPYHEYQELDTYRSLSKDKLEFNLVPSAIENMNIKRAKLFFAFDDGDKFQQQDMKKTKGDLFSYEMPRDGKGRILKYYLEASDGENTETFPRGAPMISYIFYYQRSGADNFDRQDSNKKIISVFDFVNISRMIRDQSIIDESSLKRYDYNKDAKVDEADLIMLGNILNRDKLYKQDMPVTSVEIINQSDGIIAVFSDGSKMIIPSDIQNSKLYILAENGTAFNILNNVYFVTDELSVIETKSKNERQFGIAGFGVENKGLIVEINRQSLWRKLFLFYLKDHPKDYLFESGKRFFRMWITVGSRDISASHPPPGGRYYLFTLATIFSLSVFLLCLTGIFILRRRIKDVIFVLVPIIYFPLTHSWYMVNARHTLAANPFALVFVGVAIYPVTKLLINAIRRKK